MAPKNEAEESHQGLLELKSLEGPYDSADSDASDIDATEYLNKSGRTPKAPASAYATTHALKSIRQTFSRRAKCLTILLILATTLWTLLATGGYLVYKHSIDGQSPPWYPTPRGGTSERWRESYEKAAALVEKMTLVEKVNITTGTGWSMGLAVGNTGPANGVGFPGLALQDGPLGIRFANNATAWPAGITIGATWNKELMFLRGQGHGLEARLKDINVLLGPCVGPLGRMPAGGRNWEGFGSDPYLQGIAAAQTIRGIQSEGVMATIKHFVGNEQEHFRQSLEWGLPNAMSSNIDDRTLHEVYGWPFADAIESGVASVMCSYQQVNNSYACGNSKLLNGYLKDELGFQGFVQSDWLAQRSGVASALAGLDVSMPGDGVIWAQGKALWGGQLTKAVLNGSVPMERMSDMATRVVAAWYQLGQDDQSKFDRKGPNFSSWTNDKMGRINYGSPEDTDIVEVNQYVNVQSEEHEDLARQIAIEGTVLVKNEDNILPLNKDGWPKNGAHEQKMRIGIFGDDAGRGRGPNACPDRGCNQGTLGSGWGSGAAEFPYLIAPADALKDAFGDGVDLTSFPTNDPPTKKAPEIIHDQDICIVFVNADGGEGYIAHGGIKGDRNDLYLQNGGEDLVVEIAEACGDGDGSTVVVIHSVGPVIVDQWLHLPGIKAVIMANLPGQESGNAITDILLGNANPSGKLPYTVGKTLKNYGPGGQIMYYPNGVVPQQDFSEGLYIEYRHFDKYNIKPTFEFGFGLSYTTFEYSDLEVISLRPKSAFPAPRPDQIASPDYDTTIPAPSTALFPNNIRRLSKYIYPYINKISDIKSGNYPYPSGYNTHQQPSPAGGEEGGNPDLWVHYANITVEIKNTGSRSGKEVAQLYLSYEELGEDAKDVDFPVKVLRGFEKVALEVGETKMVAFQLTRRDLSYWDVERQNWILPTEGRFTVSVGASSRDLRLKGWL